MPSSPAVVENSEIRDPQSGVGGFALIRVHVSVLIMGHTTLFAKLLPYSAVTIIALRAIVAFVALGILLGLRKRLMTLFPRRIKDWGLFLALGSLMALHWVTYFHSIQVSTVSVGMISLFTYPVFTAILEPLFFGGRLEFRELLIGTMVLVGLGLVAFSHNWEDVFLLWNFSDLLTGRSYATGVFWGLFSAIVYSVRNLLSKKNLEFYSSSAMMTHQLWIAFLILLPFVEWETSMLEMQNWMGILALGVVFTALAHTLYLQSLRAMKATTAGILSTISPVYGTLAAWFYLSEVPGWGVFVGGALVLGGSVWESLRFRKS